MSVGDILSEGAGGIVEAVSPGTAGGVLTSNGAGVAPTFSGVVLARSIVTLSDAQIKALPTTGIQVVAAQGSGFRAKVLSVSVYLNTAAGAYTNVDATYSAIALSASGFGLTNGIVNDSAAAPALSQMSNFLGVAAAQTADLGVPAVYATDDPGSLEWVLSGDSANGATATSSFDNVAVLIGADNNGSGDFTGGNAANTMKVVVYYVRETI